MTTLAIIGGGIAGRSLIYTLAKEKKSFEKISLFYSDKFAFPCTQHSTAIVAPRGLRRGHSPLGDVLIDGLEMFKNHVSDENPPGVEKIFQYASSSLGPDSFKTRYPQGKLLTEFGEISFRTSTLTATDQGYLIDPKTYTDWLLVQAKEFLGDKLEVIDDFIIGLEQKDRIQVQTHMGRTMDFDKVIFATGAYSKFWQNMAPESKLKTSKPSQGSYLEFSDISWKMPSFSLTLDGDNLIWSHPFKRLLIGSTTQETSHIIAPIQELTHIYDRLTHKLNLGFPKFNTGIIKVGLREKAQKRAPYLFHDGNLIFAGGFYKNGYSLSLKIASDLSRQLLWPAHRTD